MHRKQQYKTNVCVEGVILPLPVVGEFDLVFDLLDLQDNPDQFLPSLLSTFYTYFLPQDIEFDDPFLLTNLATSWFGEIVKIIADNPRLEGIEEKMRVAKEAKTISNSVGKPKTMVEAATGRAKEHIGKNRFNIMSWVCWVSDKSSLTAKEVNAMCWQEFIHLSNMYQAFEDVRFAQEEAEKKKQEATKNRKAMGM